MKHLGDITKINGAEIPIVDVITGGSPCQDLSVAGKRAGLAGERSGLFMEQIRVIKEMREHDRRAGRTDEYIRPRYMVWENVPGAFSSGNPKGADFAAVIEEIIKVAEPRASVSVCIPNGGWTKSGCFYADDGSWSIAWRVHDAQFWGVPQRRKRIALVADFGGKSAPEILFERKGLSGDLEPCGETGQETAGTAGEGVEGASCYGLDHVMLSGGTTYQGRGYYNNVSGCLKTQPHGVCDTISFQERGGKPGGGKGILIQHEHVGALSTLNNQSVLQTREPILLESNQTHATVQTDGISTTFPASMGMGGGYVPMVTAYGIDQQGGSVMGVSEDVTGALRAEEQGHQPVVAFTQNQRNEVRDLGDIAGALAAEPGMHQQTYVYENHSQDSRYKPLGEVSETVSAKYGTGGNNQPLVVSGTYQAVTGALTPGAHPGSYNGQDAYNDMLIAQTISCGNPWDPQSERVFHGDGAWHSLAGNSGGGQSRDAVMVFDKEMYNCGKSCTGSPQIRVDNVAPTCRADAHPSGVAYNAIVRRLTPLECERLQGYPDGWTDIGEWVDTKGKKHKAADSPRYKALGNSIALPFWQWMAERMVRLIKNDEPEKEPTMASLFSGIGGFELVFARAGCKPKWNSEIESFPEAVTRVHFGDDDLGLEGDYERYL